MCALTKLDKMSKLIPLGYELCITVSTGSIRRGSKWVRTFDYYIISNNNVVEINKPTANHNQYGNLNYYYYDLICNGKINFNADYNNLRRISCLN